MTIVQASFMIITYDRQNIFIIQATDECAGSVMVGFKMVKPGKG
jgi:hypothetical protein